MRPANRRTSAQVEAKVDPASDPIPEPTRRGKGSRPRQPHFDLRGHLYRITGVDLTQIDNASSEPVWSHDGRKIAFDVGQAAEVHVRDLAIGTETTLFPMPGESAAEGWSPDDRYVIYDLHGTEANSKSGIWIVDTTGQHLRYPLTQTSGDARWARLSPDGKWLAYAGYETRPAGNLRSAD